MRLDAYIRVSQVAGRSGESFISPADQRERIEAWAVAHKATIAAWYEELDESGGRDDRPMFLEALGRCERGETGGIIVAKLNRFSRSVAGAAVAIRRLDDAGAELVSVEESLDTSTSFGRFGRTMMLALAELELERVTESWLTARRFAVERGVHISARPPAGYRRADDGRLEAHPTHGPIVRSAFALAASGVGPAAVADYLTLEGVPTKYGGRWTVGAASKLLANRAYTGEARSGAFTLPGAHEALVDVATFEAALAARTASRPRGRSVAMLQGLVRCAGCRYVMSAYVDPAGRTRYRCNKRHPGGACGAPAAISATLVEPWVEGVVLEALEEGGWLFVPEPLDDRELDSAAVLEAEAEVELRAYRDAPGILAALGADLFAEGLELRRRALAEARATLADIRGRRGVGALPNAKRAADVFVSAALEAKRALLFRAVDAVFVRKGRQGARAPALERCVIFPRGSGPRDLPRRGRLNAVDPLDWPEAVAGVAFGE